MKILIFLVLLIELCFCQNHPEEPLILTPLLETQQFARALKYSRVFDGQNLTSYSGFLTVNRHFNSNMFFWFFPAEENYESAPIIIWLQGEPGMSSLFGLFVENGPFRINNTLNIEKREHRWTKTHSVLYIDNPVGAGFSFSHYEGYCTDQKCVGENMYIFLRQFYAMFPELRANDLYVAGESYAGKYIPAIARTIHQKNPKAEYKINLKGIAIGNGFIDPINQINYDEVLYQLGYINKTTKTKMKALQTKIRTNILLRKWPAAVESFSNTLFSSFSLFSRASGYDYFYNLLHNNNYLSTDILNLIRYLRDNQVRMALHVGGIKFQWLEPRIQIKLTNDLLQSAAPMLSELINNNYKVLIYCGQLDLFVGNPQISNMIDNLKYKSKVQFKKAPRYKWYVNRNLAGYLTKAGNFTNVLVRNAGHMVPFDQPEAALDLITNFIKGDGFDLKIY